MDNNWCQLKTNRFDRWNRTLICAHWMSFDVSLVEMDNNFGYQIIGKIKSLKIKKLNTN